MSVSLGAYELAPASVTTLIRQSLDIGPSAAGLIVSVMFGTAVVASIPVGVVLDRTNSRYAVAVAVGLLLVAGVWGWYAASAGSFAMVLASRVLGGLAYVVVWNAGIDVVGRSFEAERQATAVATFTASGPVGFAVGQAAAPVVAEAFGWPAIFPAFTALSVVGLALFWPTSRGSGRARDTRTPTFADLSRVVTDRRVWLVGVLGFLGYSLYLFVNSWAPSYLTDELRLSLVVSGALSALFPAVGVLSRISGGVLSDRLFDGRRRPVVLASFAVATPAVATFTFLPTVPLVVAALLVAGFAIQLCLGLVFAYVRELVEPAVAATAVAFLTSVGLAGAFLAPIVGGALIDVTSYDVAFLLAGLLGLVGVAVAWRAPEP
ncbi:nitrate/nitrite transporter [Haloarchaeobius litoreus]|uniref:Nitrate/nitrite transporter n=1 Tax=Haloarchaeobius litoreus TaxID=755306 RepID=A0ABD6DN67_9EURY